MMNQSALHSHTLLGTTKVALNVPKTFKTLGLGPVLTQAGIVAGVVEQETPVIVTEFFDVPCQVPMITLRIICKAYMHGGFCYLGVDERRPRILRPICNTEPAKCCWDVHFVVGSLIEFQVIHHPDDPQPANQHLLTAYPHRNEDLIVYKGTTAPVGHLPGCEWNPINYLPLCKNNIYEIFPGLSIQLNQKCFVQENVQCPSAGILLTEQKDIKIVSFYNEWKQKNTKNVHINKCSGPLSNMELIFPYTALEEMFFPSQEYNGKCMVILGLGRPFAGDLGNPFNPRRCYVLVVGIIRFQMPQQYQQIM